MSKKSTKKPIDYIQRLKIIRPFISFNYDLRKPLTRGQKSAITKAFKDIRPYKSKRFIPLKRRKNESVKEFLSRSKRIKRAYGQDNKSLNGVFVDIPRNVKATFTVDGHLAFITKNFVEIIIEADHVELLFDVDRYLEDIWFLNQFDIIFINYSGHSRSMGFVKEDERGDNPVFKEFRDEVKSLLLKYRDTFEYAVSGFILRICKDAASDSCY